MEMSDDYKQKLVDWLADLNMPVYFEPSDIDYLEFYKYGAFEPKKPTIVIEVKQEDGNEIR